MPAAPVTRRASDIKRIHVLRGRLGMDEDAYRDLIGSLFNGARSSTALDDAQRQRFVLHLQGLMRQLGNFAGADARPQRLPLPSLPPRQRKMFSVWQQLADAGLVKDRRMAALDAWITRRTWPGGRVDNKAWLGGKGEDQVIEALKAWLRRGHDMMTTTAETGDGGR